MNDPKRSQGAAPEAARRKRRSTAVSAAIGADGRGRRRHAGAARRLNRQGRLPGSDGFEPPRSGGTPAPRRGSGAGETPGPRAAASRERAGEAVVCHDVDQASKEMQAKARTLLVNGATFEDTVEALNGAGKVAVTLRAVRNFYHGHQDIQEERIQRQMATAGRLKKALQGGNSAQSRLAEAVLLTGLMGVDDKTEAASVQSAIKVQAEQDRYRIDLEMNKLRMGKMRADMSLLRARRKHEAAKTAYLTMEIGRLRDDLQNADDGSQVTPEAMERIQEIYGLLTDHKPERARYAPAARE